MTSSKHIGDNASFVNMLQVASEDKAIHATLEQILALPAQRRKDVIQTLVRDMRTKGAPAGFVAAFECLLDDAVAATAREVINRNQRPD